MKRKLLIIFFCFIMITGCNKEISNNNSNTNMESVTTEIIELEMISPLPTETVNLVCTDFGMYFTSNQKLMFYDDKTSETTVVCSRPECLHQDETCTAYMPDISTSLFTNKNQNKLFYTEFNAIRVMEYDGSNNIELYISEENNLINKKFVDDGENIYFIETVLSTEISEHRIKRLNYDTHNVETIYTLTNNVKIIGAFGNKLILGYVSDNPYNIEISILDLNTFEEEHIESDNQHRFIVDNFLYTVINNSSLEKQDLITGTKEIVSENINFEKDILYVSVEASFGDWLLIATGEGMEYLIDTKTGEFKRFEIELTADYMESVPKDYISPVFIPITYLGEIKDNIIVYVGDRETVYIQVDSTGVARSYPTIEGVFATISVEDFINSRENYTVIN